MPWSMALKNQISLSGLGVKLKISDTFLHLNLSTDANLSQRNTKIK
jgi:hypothetical protein